MIGAKRRVGAGFFPGWAKLFFDRETAVLAAGFGDAGQPFAVFVVEQTYLVANLPAHHIQKVVRTCPVKLDQSRGCKPRLLVEAGELLMGFLVRDMGER